MSCNSKVYDPMDIANYLIYLAKSDGKQITNLKLQKILFFVNAKYLVDHSGTPLMTKKFERWQYGPAMHTVYSNFKHFGAQPITEPAGKYVFDKSDPFNADFEPFNPATIEKDTTVSKTVKDVFDALINQSTSDLVDYTHNETIWSNFTDAIMNRNAPEYENEEIFTYFKENPQARKWESGK